MCRFQFFFIHISSTHGCIYANLHLHELETTLRMKYRTLNKYRNRNGEKKPKVVIFERNNKINKLYGREIIISGRNIFALIISNKLKCGGCAGRFRSESPIIYRTHCRSVIILCFILLCNVALCYYRA